MKRYYLSAALCIAAMFQPQAAVAGTKLSNADLIELQAMLQSHIEASLVNGALLQVAEKDGQLVSYFPTKTHPKIMQTDAFLILCADFATSAGEMVMANFYVARNDSGYVVFETTFGADPALDALMKSGQAVMAN